MTRKARCPCGRLQIDCEDEPYKVSLCHCQQCQRRTGAPFGVAAFFAASSAKVSGTSRTYRRNSDSGYDVIFHFCGDCGATVFWYPERMKELVAVACGLLFCRPVVSGSPKRSTWSIVTAGLRCRSDAWCANQPAGYRTRPTSDNGVKQRALLVHRQEDPIVAVEARAGGRIGWRARPSGSWPYKRRRGRGKVPRRLPRPWRSPAGRRPRLARSPYSR